MKVGHETHGGESPISGDINIGNKTIKNSKIEEISKHEVSVWWKILSISICAIIVIMAGIIILCNGLSLEGKSTELVLTFVGILATFIIVGNFSQTQQIRKDIEKDFDEKIIKLEQENREQLAISLLNIYGIHLSYYEEKVSKGAKAIKANRLNALQIIEQHDIMRHYFYFSLNCMRYEMELGLKDYMDRMPNMKIVAEGLVFTNDQKSALIQILDSIDACYRNKHYAVIGKMIESIKVVSEKELYGE